MRSLPPLALLTLTLLILPGTTSPTGAAEFASHPPTRPLPAASDRPMTSGPAYFVDAERGDDAAAGSREKPWRSINHSLRQLKPGDTLYLRGGIYYEHVDVPHSGAEGRPITIRSFPGELAVLDGGLREFLDAPADAWQPFPDGAPGEFVSTRTYPQFAARPIVHAFIDNGWEPFYGIEDQRPVVLGHFADSMTPLHGYRTAADLRDDSMLWDVRAKGDADSSIYCGPGIWFNRQTARFHIRLAHTTLAGLGDRAYRGETDPRKLPLAISGPYGQDVLRINGVSHLRFEDLVLRGASGSALINLYGADDIAFDGVTVYGGSPGLLVKATSQLKIVNCAFRGLAAPWSSRASMKYRGTPSYMIITQSDQPQNHDFEIAYSEFTDGHDFAWIRYVKNLRFHHNFVDNFNDDGLECGAKTRDHEIFIYQNRISRCLLTLTAHEIDKDESPLEANPGSGVFVARNVFDLREGTFKGPPQEEDPTGAYLQSPSNLCGDHGGPTWAQYHFYHNTVLAGEKSFRGYYGFGIGGRGLRNSTRRVLNNIFIQLRGTPGLNIAPGDKDLLVDANLHWGVVDGPGYQGNYFEKDGRPKSAAARESFPETWMKHDLFADPKLTRLDANPTAQLDLTLLKGSPAMDAGAPLPQEWFDPLRAEDDGQPDLGALPLGMNGWGVGVRGRRNLFGGADQLRR